MSKRTRPDGRYTKHRIRNITLQNPMLAAPVNNNLASRVRGWTVAPESELALPDVIRVGMHGNACVNVD